VRFVFEIDVLAPLSKEDVTMKDVSLPHDTDLPEEKRKRSESSRFKPDSQTGKKYETGPFTSPELNRHSKIFGKHKDQSLTHPSEVPPHQMACQCFSDGMVRRTI